MGLFRIRINQTYPINKIWLPKFQFVYLRVIKIKVMTDIILSFVGVFAVTYGIMAYISGVVGAVVKKSKFSQLEALFMISLGMSILLNL